MSTLLLCSGIRDSRNKIKHSSLSRVSLLKTNGLSLIELYAKLTAVKIK